MKSLKKLEAEFKSAKKLTAKANAMKDGIYEALTEFCRQNEEFAQAVEQNDKTFADCCEAVAKGVGNSISDMEAYTRAVRFYFDGAVVKFNMQIFTSESEADLAAQTRSIDTALTAPQALSLSLDSLLDF